VSTCRVASNHKKQSQCQASGDVTKSQTKKKNGPVDNINETTERSAEALLAMMQSNSQPVSLTTASSGMSKVCGQNE
jgi:hypothetical protein